MEEPCRIFTDLPDVLAHGFLPFRAVFGSPQSSNLSFLEQRENVLGLFSRMVSCNEVFSSLYPTQYIMIDLCYKTNKYTDHSGQILILKYSSCSSDTNLTECLLMRVDWSC